MNLPSIQIKHLHIHMPALFPSGPEVRRTTKPAPTSASERHVLIHDGAIVVDNQTGIWWATEESDRLDHDAATKFCIDCRLGGFEDWGMPDRPQAEGILDFERHNPMLPSLFKSHSEYVWTRTQTPWTKDEKGSARSFFIVGTDYGGVGGSNAYDRFRVRPCRVGGPVPSGQ